MIKYYVSLLCTCVATSLCSEEAAMVVPYKPIEVGQEYTLLKINTKVDRVSLKEGLQELMTGVEDPSFNENLIDQVALAAAKNQRGTYIEHWDNGTIKVRIPYQNGFLHGHVHGWYPTGCDAFKGFYDEGKRLGIHITFWFDDDPKSSDSYMRVLRYDEEGRLHGGQKTYYPGYGLESCLLYKHGILDGLNTLYEDKDTYNGKNRQRKKTYYTEERIYKNGVLQSTKSYMDKGY